MKTEYQKAVQLMIDGFKSRVDEIFTIEELYESFEVVQLKIMLYNAIMDLYADITQMIEEK